MEYPVSKLSSTLFLTFSQPYHRILAARRTASEKVFALNKNREKKNRAHLLGSFLHEKSAAEAVLFVVVELRGFEPLTF